MEKQYLTEREVGQLYRMSIRNLQKRRYEGRGPRYFKFGGSIRYRVADLDAFMKWHEPKADKV
jgi:hypothetical protein